MSSDTLLSLSCNQRVQRHASKALTHCVHAIASAHSNDECVRGSGHLLRLLAKDEEHGIDHIGFAASIGTHH